MNQTQFRNHKWLGECRIIKKLAFHGFVVQSETRPEGVYLNVDEWDFIDKPKTQREFIDSVMAEAARLGHKDNEMTIFVEGAIFAKTQLNNNIK